MQELYDGLIATSQNCWPSVRFDIGAINDAISRYIPAGFYYKTFMWPPTPAWWLRYEHLIRRAAGLGRSHHARRPDHYEHQYEHCDVLVIGAGPAGLAAARRAAHAGARVLVCDERPQFGGSVLGPPRPSADRTLPIGSQRRMRQLAEQRRRYAVARGRPRSATTTATSSGCSSASRSSRRPPQWMPRQRLWKVRAKSGRARGGSARASSRLREQRSARNDARRRGPHVRRTLRRVPGHTSRRSLPTTTPRMRPR
jgi:sarcosine oxidase subunit alpha